MNTMKTTARPHLNVRSGPGKPFLEIGQFQPGTVVTVVEHDPGGSNWFRVTAGTVTGWVSAEYLAPNNAAPATGGTGGKTWRVARSLDTLVEQVNERAPQRNKKNDGTIGDEEHQKQGSKSQHNPIPAAPGAQDKRGVVTARDITHDPAGGCDCQALATALVASQDPRIKYIIWRGRICSSKVQPWKWREYTGPNKHLGHLHISVDPNPALYDDTKPWKI